MDPEADEASDVAADSSSSSACVGETISCAFLKRCTTRLDSWVLKFRIFLGEVLARFCEGWSSSGVSSPPSRGLLRFSGRGGLLLVDDDGPNSSGVDLLADANIVGILTPRLAVSDARLTDGKGREERYSLEKPGQLGTGKSLKYFFTRSLQ